MATTGDGYEKADLERPSETARRDSRYRDLTYEEQAFEQSARGSTVNPITRRPSAPPPKLHIGATQDLNAKMSARMGTAHTIVAQSARGVNPTSRASYGAGPAEIAARKAASHRAASPSAPARTSSPGANKGSISARPGRGAMTSQTPRGGQRSSRSVIV